MNLAIIQGYFFCQLQVTREIIKFLIIVDSFLWVCCGLADVLLLYIFPSY